MPRSEDELLGPGLPGVELIRAGLYDLRQGVESEPSLLVEIGAPRLRACGLDVPASGAPGSLPEHRLYHRLIESGNADPYSAYNALLRRLVSFERALEQALFTG